MIHGRQKMNLLKVIKKKKKLIWQDLLNMITRKLEEILILPYKGTD